jgi:GT2 family glycosyltransferase
MNEQEMGRSPQPACKLLAVVVIYKMRICESSTVRTLQDAAKRISRDKLELGILIWDNTPGGQDPGEIPEAVRYEAAPGNPGLAQAYNRALETARAEGYDWLLTLDQDSTLPTNFIIRIAEVAQKIKSTLNIAAIVPQVAGDGHNLSPFQFALGAIPRWFPYGTFGLLDGATYALNSGATFRVVALSQIGGYDPLFPLDVSDINLFHLLHRAGKRVFLAGDLLVSHDFALFDKHRRMSIERYHAQLFDECAFWDMNMGFLARVERMIRLAGRACKDLLTPEARPFRRLATSEIKRRLLTPRPQRIAEWTKWATERYKSPTQVADAATDPSKRDTGRN